MERKEIVDYLKTKGYPAGEALYFSGLVLEFDPALRAAFEHFAATGEKPEFTYGEWTFDEVAERTFSKPPHTFIYMHKLMRDPNYSAYIKYGLIGEE